MNNREFEKWQKFHKLGKFKYTFLVVLFYILVGNIVSPIINLIRYHDITLTTSGIVFTTVLWAIVGICYSSLTWKSKEAAYNKLLKSGYVKEKAE